MFSVHDYYRDINVIRRILEYCGVPEETASDFKLEENPGRLDDSQKLREITKLMTVEYISGYGKNLLETFGKKASSRYNEHLGELLDRDLNLFRSLWDREKVTFLLDIEYVSHKYPGEVYLNPSKIYGKMEPLYRCLWDLFSEYGIKPMTIVTGQGYHFVFDINSYNPSKWGIKTVTEVAKKLVDIGHVEETIKGKYQHLPWHTKRKRKVELDLGRAFDSVGKLLEFILHQAIPRLTKYGLRLPVGIGDLVPGNPNQEMINLDLSTYASPLYTRVTRSAFSIHDKHKANKWTEHLPVHITIPRYTPFNDNELGLEEVFANRRNFHNSANYAAAIRMNVPEYTDEVLKLIDDYKNSKLFQFHQDFDKTEHENPDDWHRTYDSFNLSEIPPCVSEAVGNPNPSLLQPAQIQTLVRVLTGKEWWHPKHVAGLIRSKYERNWEWDLNWGKPPDMQMSGFVCIRVY
jgi:hypothetical protein